MITMNASCSDLNTGQTGSWQPAGGDFAGLPIFQRDYASRKLFYTPGLLVLLPESPDEAVLDEARSSLRSAAVRARLRWEDLFSAPYAPLALTLYLHNSCQMRCAYCFTTGKADNNVMLSPRQVIAAGKQVAENCRKNGRPMQLILHGGGEPTRSRRQVDAIMAAVGELASARGVSLSSYIATNGVLSAQKAAWLAARFHLVGLSCDGSAIVHNAQRPTRSGANSLPYVERTARILREMSRPFHVRMTVTPASMPRLAESVDYICRVLRPLEIHIEPVYAGADPAQAAFTPEQAADLLSAYKEGRQVGAAYGICVETSGSRPADIHGPYCNALRPVLNLLPDGSATACFKLTQSDPGDRRWLGPLRENEDSLVDLERLSLLRSSLRANLEACKACFNALHCARGCPDSCQAERPVQAGAFRCMFNRILAEDAILETARRGIAQGKVFMREEVRL